MCARLLDQSCSPLLPSSPSSSSLLVRCTRTRTRNVGSRESTALVVATRFIDCVHAPSMFTTMIIRGETVVLSLSLSSFLSSSLSSSSSSFSFDRERKTHTQTFRTSKPSIARSFHCSRSRSLTMQPDSPLSNQARYASYPIVPSLSTSSLLIPQYPPMTSPQSLKSFDTNVFGPNMPSYKTTRAPGSSLQNHSNSSVSSSSTSSRSGSHDADLRRLILFNLPLDLVREYLELYIEHLSGEAEIERIDYSNLEDTTVMVTFKSELGELPQSR